MGQKALSSLALLLAASPLSIVSADQIVGDDTDENGCKASAGYSWCESSSSCERPGDCPSGDIVGDDTDENGCKASAGYSWCEKTGSCERAGDCKDHHHHHDA